MVISGLLLLAVVGYIVTPFVTKNALTQFSVSAEQCNNLETAIEPEIQAFRKQDKETSLQAEE